MDPEDVREVAMQLREAYPDDDEFAAAMARLEAELSGEADHDDEEETPEDEP